MIDTFSSTLLAWLLTYAIHSTVLLGLAWLLTRRRGWSAGASDLIWKTALVGGIVTAAVQLRLDVRPLGSVSLYGEARATAIAPTSATSRREARALPAPDLVVGTEHASPQENVLPDERVPRADPRETLDAGSSPFLSAHALAVLGWAIVALVLALSYASRRLILVGRLGDRRAVTDGRLLDELELLADAAGLRRAPRLTTTDRISSPIALGVREICVPETALTALDLEQQRSMLAHELAHLARRDPLWLAFATLVERVLWIQPLNRIARREIATSAEYLCDEWAVRRTGSGVALARCLAQVAEWIQASPLGVPVAGMAEERSLLVARVEKLVGGVVPDARPRRALAMASVAVIVATVAIAPGVTGRAARASAIGARGDTAAIRTHAEESTLTAKLPVRDSAVVVALIRRLQDEDADVRAAAAQSLGKLEDSRAVTGLIAALSDREAKVRSAAAQALAQFTDPRAITGLSALLRDSSTDVRKEALDALSQYEDGVSSAGIVRLLDDPDADLRQSAAHTLGKLKDRSSGAGLSKLVRDPNSNVRQAAIEAIAELHDTEHASAIVPALADANHDVRQQALAALNDLRYPIVESTMLALLRDLNADVRARAADVAGERSMLGTIPSLRRLLEDPNGDVRENAVSALSNIADPAANEALRAALTSKDAKVRRAAAEALGDRR